ncbi:imidazoleglycerol-phosphate dehydratase HisB [Pueribacillus sp. YX66]|uniref:imidazoleglycerol-phosphate dehydratase HisB n=1 Tax=Pueribacillus sp. YX66 TaxID=3229242 RepID=UPI00358D38B8
MSREATVTRETKETQITLLINLDGDGSGDLQTPVPFMTHMLDAFRKHGQFNLDVNASGDVEIDAHHTTEDLGICLGQAFHKALGNKYGIKRFGNAFVPMDDALAQVVVDLSDRPHVEFRGSLPTNRVGSFDTELVHEFLWKLALEARMNLHVIIHYGMNTHHMIEAVFKALGRALHEAVSIDPKVKGIPSTKGKL